MKFGEQKSDQEIRNGVMDGILKRGNAALEKSPLDIANYDPVSRKDYEAVFRKLITSEDTIVAVAVGSVDIIGYINYQVPALIDVAKEKGATVILNDILHNNLLTYKDRKELREDQHVHLVTSNTLKLPLPDASVRGITSSNLINCPPQEYGNASSIKEQGRFLLREWYRVLKPGGFLIVTSFGYSVSKEKLHMGIYNNSLKKGDFLTLQDLERYLEEAGFENIAELPVREDISFIDANNKPALVEEVGGFLARKPKE